MRALKMRKTIISIEQAEQLLSLYDFGTLCAPVDRWWSKQIYVKESKGGKKNLFNAQYRLSSGDYPYWIPNWVLACNFKKALKYAKEAQNDNN